MSAEQATCSPDAMTRFWERVEKTETCWLWRGSVGSNGYGRFCADGTNYLVHRFAYEVFIGPIPEGLTIDHVYDRGCRHKNCVNPDHLEAVTGQENQARAFARITHCPHGHEYTPENMLRNRRECRQCNRERALRRYHALKAAA